MAISASTSAQQHAHQAPGRSAGQPTLCLHCSTGSSKQWRSLAARLGERRRIIAPDLLGYGDNPPWPRGRSLRLGEEVRRLLPLLASTPRPVDVVAHSFGAAVAIKLALEYPQKVRSLCIYEPVLLGLLNQDAASTSALSEILMMSAKIARSLSDGDADRAAARFIDFWSGDGSWKIMPEARREIVRARIQKVRADFGALLADETTLADLARLDIPVLCLSGARSPAATQRIADLLATTLPRVQSRRFEQAGHMGPLTHARKVEASIEKFFTFLSRQGEHWRDASPSTPFTARAA